MDSDLLTNLFLNLSPSDLVNFLCLTPETCSLVNQFRSRLHYRKLNLEIFDALKQTYPVIWIGVVLEMIPPTAPVSQFDRETYCLVNQVSRMLNPFKLIAPIIYIGQKLTDVQKQELIQIYQVVSNCYEFVQLDLINYLISSIQIFFDRNVYALCTSSDDEFVVDIIVKLLSLVTELRLMYNRIRKWEFGEIFIETYLMQLLFKSTPSPTTGLKNHMKLCKLAGLALTEVINRQCILDHSARIKQISYPYELAADQSTFFEEYFKRNPSLSPLIRHEWVYPNLVSTTLSSPQDRIRERYWRSVLIRLPETVFTRNEFQNFNNRHMSSFVVWWKRGYYPMTQLLKARGECIEHLIPTAEDITRTLYQWWPDSTKPVQLMVTLLTIPVTIIVPDWIVNNMKPPITSTMLIYDSV